jgi:hypothetical protein
LGLFSLYAFIVSVIYYYYYYYCDCYYYLWNSDYLLVMQISKRLGSGTPFIISTASGIIGRDALTNELKEV